MLPCENPTVFFGKLSTQEKKIVSTSNFCPEEEGGEGGGELNWAELSSGDQRELLLQGNHSLWLES